MIISLVDLELLKFKASKRGLLRSKKYIDQWVEGIKNDSTERTLMEINIIKGALFEYAIRTNLSQVRSIDIGLQTCTV
jgi:hypothetical protein